MSDWMVEITESAERDLEDAALYIRDRLGSKRAAFALLEAFEGCVIELSSSPAARPLVRDARLARRGYRWIPVKNYMVFYTLNEGNRIVIVERVLYARSNWVALL